MGVEGVDVGQEGAHLSGNTGAEVFGRKAVKVSAERKRGQKNRHPSSDSIYLNQNLSINVSKLY